jgi:DNA-binding transcriptional LysR family regulator
MIPNLDIDLLKTFIAIAETGGFTRAAGEVNKTQGAVSMQMKRLEELLGRQLFIRDGRQSRLTPDGELLLDYARRIIRLNDEAVTTFSEPAVSGIVRFGVPDDYADNVLPELLARFSRTHPMVQLDVECLDSPALRAKAQEGGIDLGLISAPVGSPGMEVLRTEPLVWVTSARHCAHDREVVPLAVAQVGCWWRQKITDALDAMKRPYRIAYASDSSNAVKAAVVAGLAVGAIPKICVRSDMKVLTEAEGFPPLHEFDLGIVRAPGKRNSAVDALVRHLVESFSNIETVRIAAE